MIDTVHGQAASIPDAADTRIIALFHEWMAAERFSAALPGGDDDSPEQAEYEAACERSWNLLAEVADIPANGLTGFVIKAYLHLFSERGGSCRGDPCAICAFEVNEDGYTATKLGRSLIADMIRFVPELPPLAEAGEATCSPEADLGESDEGGRESGPRSYYLPGPDGKSMFDKELENRALTPSEQRFVELLERYAPEYVARVRPARPKRTR